MIVARRPFPRIPRYFRGETSSSIPKVPKLTFSNPPLPNSFPCHTSAKSTRNSFRCHTYKFRPPASPFPATHTKNRGCPLGSAAVLPPLSCPSPARRIGHLREARYHITSF